MRGKSEIRISKSETNPKSEMRMFQTSQLDSRKHIVRTSGNPKSESRNPKQIPNLKCECLKQVSRTSGEWRRKMRINSVLSWTSAARSASSAALSRVSRSRSQYRVSFDSFREIRIRILKVLLSERLVRFDVVRSDRSRRPHHLLDVLGIADRARQPSDKRPQTASKLERPILKVILSCLGVSVICDSGNSNLFRISRFGFRIYPRGHTASTWAFLSFAISNFGFVSDFEIRISDFSSPVPHQIQSQTAAGF